MEFSQASKVLVPNRVTEPCNTSGKKPIVSVAIPTFNRPTGLATTLADIQSQTYTNLEILIGDNASTDPEVRAICDRARAADYRIVVLRHDSNLGASANFFALLAAAEGDFFMWAADDDRHEPEFVATCLEPFLNDSTGKLACVMTGGSVYNHVSHERSTPAIPTITATDSTSSSVLKLLLCPYPAMIYGLFRRAALLEVGVGSFDWADCFLPLNLLFSGYRVETKPDCYSYTAGILSLEYTPKPAVAKTGRLFTYTPFLLSTLRAIWSSTHVSFVTRGRATIAAALFSVSCFQRWEKHNQPLRWWFNALVLCPVLRVLNKVMNGLWIKPGR
jgi:glycosyltransferase involved in cell wall biosynthesis